MTQSSAASDAPSSSTRSAILATVALIPIGKVATYGQIAELAGCKGASRAVGRHMRTLPDNTELPWHRVVNAQGKISIPHQGAIVQRARLEAEGVVFDGEKISLKTYLWRL